MSTPTAQATIAVDSSAVVAWVIQQEPLWHAVDALFKGTSDLVMPGPVLAETIAVSHARGNTQSGASIFQSLFLQGLRVAHASDPAGATPGTSLVRVAELREASLANPRIKPNGQKVPLSMADCQILVICEVNGWTIVTADKGMEYAAQQGQTSATVYCL